LETGCAFGVPASLPKLRSAADRILTMPLGAVKLQPLTSVIAPTPGDVSIVPGLRDPLTVPRKSAVSVPFGSAAVIVNFGAPLPREIKMSVLSRLIRRGASIVTSPAG